MSKLSAIPIISLIAFSVVAGQCGSATTAGQNAETSAGPAIKVMESFARASVPNGAVYMHLMNEGGADDALISVETDAAETAELHESKMDENGVMRMSPLSRVNLPTGGSAVLEPGGMHVMLIGMKEGVAQGDNISLTLNFEKSGSQTVEVEVTEGVTPEQSHEGHEQEAEDDIAQGHETDASTTITPQPQVFQVVVAAYLMDTAGFHAMDERLNEEGRIEASDADVINRVSRVLTVTDWPEELKPQVEALQTILAQYAEVLSNDDVEAAKLLASQVHEAQHDLSHAIGSWVSGHSGEQGEAESHEHEEGHGD